MGLSFPCGQNWFAIGVKLGIYLGFPPRLDFILCFIRELLCSWYDLGGAAGRWPGRR